MGIPIPKNLYGKPINAGELPVRSLCAKNYWYRLDVASDYPQLTANFFPHLGDYAKEINKALMSVNSVTTSEAYFFLNDGTYITYNVVKQDIISGPEPIKSHWKCLNDSKIGSSKIKGAVAFNNQNKEEYFFIFDNNYCTICKGNPPHDTIDKKGKNNLPEFPKKLDELSTTWRKTMSSLSANNRNIVLLRKGKEPATFLLVDGGRKWAWIKFLSLSTSGFKEENYDNIELPGLGVYNNNLQTGLSPSSGVDRPDDKLTGDSYAIFF